MGGFTKLRDDFGKWMTTLDPSHMPDGQFKNNPDKLEQAVFRFLYLRCLFEIAGNLDSIALHTAALVEQSEATRIAAERSNELSVEAGERSKEMLESIKTQMTELRAELKFPMFTLPGPSPLVDQKPPASKLRPGKIK